VHQGTDYIDSTGEPHFVQMLLHRYSEEAAKKNVRLVSSCGFDSIPADLGVLFTVNQLPSGKPIRVSGFMTLKAVFSGGTERSAIKSMAAPPGAVADAVPLVTAGRRVRLVTTKVQHRPEVGGWAAPLPTIDGSVVLRTASSLERYGPDFGYSHHYVHGSLGSLLAAAWVFGTLAILARFTVLREFLLKLVKKSGQGPTPEQMQQSWFKLRFVAECDGQILHTEVAGGDPGYGETSKMLAESALCLVEDRDSLPARAGVLTTAECMGDALLARLQRVGPRFRVL
jgi:saccharopine dehydrogenase (NAD+, L-glutamate forming)